MFTPNQKVFPLESNDDNNLELKKSSSTRQGDDKSINQEITNFNELHVFNIYNALNLFINEDLLPYYLDSYSLTTQIITSKFNFCCCCCC